MEFGTLEEFPVENEPGGKQHDSVSETLYNNENCNDSTVEKEMEDAMASLGDENNVVSDSEKDPGTDAAEPSIALHNGTVASADKSSEDELGDEDNAGEKTKASEEAVADENEENVSEEHSEERCSNNSEPTDEVPESQHEEPSEKTTDGEKSCAVEDSSQQDSSGESDAEKKKENSALAHSDTEETENDDSKSRSPSPKKATPQKEKRNTHKSGDESSEEAPRKLSPRARKKPEKLEYVDKSPSSKKSSSDKGESDQNVERRGRKKKQPISESEKISSDSDEPLAKKVRGSTKRKVSESYKESVSSPRTSSSLKSRNDKRKRTSESEAEDQSPRKRPSKLTNGRKRKSSGPIQFLSPKEALEVSPVVQLGPKVEGSSASDNGTAKGNVSLGRGKRTVTKRENKSGKVSNKVQSPSDENDEYIKRLKRYVILAGHRINYRTFWEDCPSTKKKIKKLKNYLTEHGLKVEASDEEDTNDSEKIIEKKKVPITEADQVGFIKIEVLRRQTQSAIHSTLAKVCGELALPTSQISTIIRSFKKEIQ